MEDNVTTCIIKEDAHKLIDRLPENSTWDDLIYEIYARQAIEKGLADSNADRIQKISDIRTKYDLP
jgi:hypothetical protein